jgi:O-antigen/teichoic acid export membrane protein
MFQKIKSLSNNKFSKDTIWLTFAQVILIGSGLLLNVIIDITFGTEVLGIFNQALSFYMIFSAFFALGINSSIIHYISGSDLKQIHTLFSSNLLITIFSTSVLTAGALLITVFFPEIYSSPEVQEAVIPILFAVPFFNINKNFMALQTAQREQRSFAILRSLRWVIIIIFIFFAAMVLKSEKSIYYAFIFTEFLLFLIYSWKCREYVMIAIDSVLIKKNLLFGSKSFVAELFSVLTSRLDIIILGYLLSQYDVGVFSFYIFFVKSLLIFPGILQQNINPIIAQSWREKTHLLLKNKISKIRKINILVIVAQFVFVMISFSIYTVLFKPDYSESILFLGINGLATLPFAYIAWGGSILVMTGQLKANINRTILTLCFSVLSIGVLTYIYGLYGACAAVTLNMLFNFFMLYKFVERKTSIQLV